MKRNTWFFYVALLLPMIAIPLWTGVSHGAIKTSDLQVNNHNNQKILAKVSTLRIPFVSNEGQVAKEVGFYAKTFGGTVYVTQKGEMVYALTQKEKDQSLMKRVKDGKGRNIRVCVLKERLLKAKNSRLQGQEKAVTKVNYFIGGKDNWKTNIPSFNIVSYGQVYDNIELTLRAHTNNVEKIFTVHPKGRVEDIRLVVDGAVSLKLNPAGELEIDTGSGTFNFSVPIAFQEIEGERKNVQVAYAVKNNTYGFKVGQYDHNFPLIIDPTLTYSTYLGGTNFEEGYDITVDGNGNAYITGVTTSSDFPTQGPYDGTLDGQDAFVAKLDAMGDTLIYSTYLGGTSAEFGYGIGVDTSGNAYVTGGTYSGNFPTTAGAFQTSHSDTAYIEAFVTKLSPDGSALVYSTFLGGLDMDDSWCISVDSSGNAYVTGYTSSSDFPIAGSPYQGVKPSGVGIADAFAAKINSDGSALAYSTYLGGGAADRGNTIHADGSGNAYITGSTLSSNFPTTTGAYQESHANTGSEDAFITKLNSTGGGLYSTFLGGTSADEGKGLVVDSGGIIHVTGYTDSTNFPTAGNPYSNTHAGGRDVFVAKFDSTGAGVDDLIYSTFLGGSSAETGNAIELDNFGNVYITGDTISTDFPTTADAYQGSLSTIDFTDAFVTKIDLTGSNLSYSSYLGGTDDDVGYVIDIDSSGNAYITGSTASSNFPTASFQTIYGGAVDAFVAKFELGAGSPPATPAAVSPVDEQRFATADPVNLQAGAFSDSDGDSHLSSFWKVRFAGSVYGRTDYDASFDFEDTTGNLATHTVDGLFEGMKYVWKVKYTDSAGNSSPYSTERSFKVGTSQAESLPQVDNGTTTADFGMISFVHWPDDDKATSVINITYDSKYYRIGTYDPTIGGYIEYGSSLTIEPGKAYWVLAREGLSINYSGVPVSLLADMDVKLEYKASTGNGWNMIACPNAANYLWVDIEIVKYNADGSIAFGPTAIADLPDPNAYIDKRLWRWDNGSYDDSTTLMEKYEGYWVQVKQADVYLHFPASAQASLSSPKTMLAALTNKTGRWLNKWILAPKAAIADAGDSPPMPMGGFSSSSESKSGASCFIATAAYGSAMAPHVHVLREFRDRFLLTNNIGKLFVAFYYKHSPNLAEVIEKYANLKAAVRISLLPIVGASWVALKLGPIATMAILILLCTGFIKSRRKVDKNKK